MLIDLLRPSHDRGERDFNVLVIVLEIVIERFEHFAGVASSRERRIDLPLRIGLELLDFRDSALRPRSFRLVVLVNPAVPDTLPALVLVCARLQQQLRFAQRFAQALAHRPVGCARIREPLLESRHRPHADRSDERLTHLVVVVEVGLARGRHTIEAEHHLVLVELPKAAALPLVHDEDELALLVRADEDIDLVAVVPLGAADVSVGELHARELVWLLAPHALAALAVLDADRESLELSAIVQLER